jgi:hypothetical protein
MLWLARSGTVGMGTCARSCSYSLYPWIARQFDAPYGVEIPPYSIEFALVGVAIGMVSALIGSLPAVFRSATIPIAGIMRE